MTNEPKEIEKCCDKCYTTYTTDDYPAHETLDACNNATCDCHKKCDNEMKAVLSDKQLVEFLKKSGFPSLAKLLKDK